MRTITAVTVARSDYGILLPVLRRIQQDPDLRLSLIVSGMHLAPEFGSTWRAIETDGFTIDDRVEMLLSSDTPEGIARSMGVGTMGFAQAYARSRPDIFLTIGDRAEMHAAVIAALPFLIPVAHIHGGEVSLGAIDDALRHSMTKLSHLHFVATERCAGRVIQMGEEPWRVTVAGAPALDNLRQVPLLTPEELERRFGFRLTPPPLLVTFHPVTLEFENTAHYVEELLAALTGANLPVIFTKPNADTNGRIAIQMIEKFVAERHAASAPAWLVDNLGTQAYFSLMNVAAAMVGNSSSGLIEAPSFKLPVVNIGNRQQGRCRAVNVIDVDYDRASIADGIRRAVDPAFRASLRDLVNPFGNGTAAETIVGRLKEVALGDGLLRKRFHEIEGEQGSRGEGETNLRFSPSPPLPLPSSGPSSKILRCVLLGGGGHARVLLDCLLEMPDVKIWGVLERDRAAWGSEMYGVKVAGGDDVLPRLREEGVTHFVVGLGGASDNGPRERLYKLAVAAGLTPLGIRHPSARCSARAEIEPSAQVLAGVAVNAGARIGANVLLNTGCIIEHDCVLEDHVHVATGAKLAGNVVVRRGAHIGAGATIRQGITVGAYAVVGAGAMVVSNVEDRTVVVGVPARALRKVA